MEVEDLIHFVFDCSSFCSEREKLMQNLEILYVMDGYGLEQAQEFAQLSNVNKLKFMLFAFQEELTDDEVKQDKETLMNFIEKRLLIIKEFCSYVAATNRFARN